MEIKRWQTSGRRAITASAIFGLGLLTACGVLRSNVVGAQGVKPPVQPSALALDLQNSFEQVAERLRPSVVYIESRKAARRNINADEGDSPFGFGAPGMPRGFRMTPPRSGPSSGSGVIVRGDGYILTNDHVVQGADKVTVRLQDGREFPGEVRRDFKSDLALVKINATGLPYAEMADSDRTKVGQWAIAFGSPFGLKDTMTVGIISALHRNASIGQGNQGRYYASLLQTDASINPGNSGGPLVDIYGRIVGINVAIESPTGTNAGIGFAIPANTARFVMDELIRKGSVTRGYLGVALRPLEAEDSKQYGVSKGALVISVSDKTPAAKAGLRVEDVIVRYNGKEARTEAELRDMIARTAPNTTVPVVVRRDGREQEIRVTLGEAPDERTATRPRTERPAQERPEPQQQGKLGVRVTDTNDTEITEALRLSNLPKEGALIAEVVPGSPASEAGVQPGDVIVRANGKMVGNAQALIATIRDFKGSVMSLVVRRGENTLLARVELE